MATEYGVRALSTHANSRVGHVCAFFGSDAELQRSLALLATNVLSELGCLSKMHSPERRVAELEDMKAAGTSTETLADSDRFSLLSWDETYLADGYFDGERMLTRLKQFLEEADRVGRNATIIGDMAWVSDDRVDWEEVLRYEYSINKLFPCPGALVVCAYDLTKVSPAVVMHAVQTHPFIFANGKLLENPLFEEDDPTLLAVPNKSPT